jgi:fluoroquinolone transport system permease protein
MMPNMLGAILGFLILDEKDDKVLSALRVMPISTGGFLLYRILFPMGFTFIVNMILPYTLDFVELDFGTVLTLAIIGAIESPFLGLVVASKAANKVEGMATFKFAGFAFMLPLFGIFITSDWYWLFGILPTFWPIKIVFESAFGQPASWLYVVGLLYNLLILIAVGYFFKKTALESTK